jgi:hypothetical protein
MPNTGDRARVAEVHDVEVVRRVDRLAGHVFEACPHLLVAVAPLGRQVVCVLCDDEERWSSPSSDGER